MTYHDAFLLQAAHSSALAAAHADTEGLRMALAAAESAAQDAAAAAEASLQAEAAASERITVLEANLSALILETQARSCL